MLTGFGKFSFETQDLTSTLIAQDLAFCPDLLDFTLETSTEESKKAYGWRGCKKVIVASNAGDEESTLTIQIADINWSTLQLSEGEIAENVNVTLPIWKEAVVGSGGVINDADLIAGNVNSTKAYLLAPVGTNIAGHLSKVASTPTVRQFAAAVGTLTFNAALVGAAVRYVVRKDLTSIPSIGKAPNPISINKLSFIGHACSDQHPNGILIHCPLVSRAGRGSLNSADDVPVLEIPFDVLTAPGERLPIHYYLPPAA